MAEPSGVRILARALGSVDNFIEKTSTMLVLSRKEGDKIQIGPGVTIEVVSIHGNRVRLGITATDNVRIVRAEVADSDDREQSK